jgi:type VI secretion system protein ImpF
MRNISPDGKSLVPSVLDRLFDDEPETQRELEWTQGATANLIRESVGRDLQCLLNARRMLSAAVERYPELADSLVNYGLPDLQSYEVRGDRDRAGLLRIIEETIRRFEPRLQQVRVTMQAQGSALVDRKTGDRRLAFEIEAVLVVEPLNDPVVFSSTLDVSRGEFGVKATR